MPETTGSILAKRGPKNRVDPWRANAQFAEVERGANGALESFSTLLLTNRECSFTCTMCDLWKNTIDEATPLGAIPMQIERALQALPSAANIKLYNSGNFFDRRAIPLADHAAIAAQLSVFRRVVVENHPRLTDHRCVEFAQLIEGQLEVALGLETIHPEALAGLNKQMCLADFDRAVDFLRKQRIDVRAFILVKPPGLDEDSGIDWAVRSVAYALSVGSQCCTLIPVRRGNGHIDKLIERGTYTEPTLRSVEAAFDQSIALGNGGRVFVDLWDIAHFSHCSKCELQRIERMRQMNLSQKIQPVITCEQCSCR
ncbi:MAG: radical SAM protein [Aureliella sp.]